MGLDKLRIERSAPALAASSRSRPWG